MACWINRIGRIMKFAGRDLIKAWLEIFRIPNLFTVPGGPLIGFLFMRAAGGSAAAINLLWTAGAATLLYMSGLVANDVADVKEDTRTRPGRPIPSGRIGHRFAIGMAILLALLGLACASFAGGLTLGVALLLQGFSLLYNFITKRWPVPGALTMGLCRGLTVLLGATVDGWHPAGLLPAGLAAAGITLYVSGVTLIADRETESVRIGFRRWIPFLSLTFCFLSLGVILKPIRLPAIGLALFCLGWTALQGHGLRGKPAPVIAGKIIGALLRGLLPIQAVLGLMAGPEYGIIALVLLALWPVSVMASRHVSAT